MDLAQIQREMAAAVMLPLTADEEMQAQTPDGRSTAAIAESFIAPNSRLTAFERLEIYNRQYWFRVLGALAEDFPALRSVVGAGAFERMSVAYLTAHPSRSFTLRNLGSKLPDWLAANPGFAGRRHRLAVDVARIEWAFVEAFDSAERTPLTLDQIATLDAGSRLALQPHLQLIALDYPADDVVLGLHHREKRQTSEAGIKHEDAPDAPAKLPRLRRRATWVAAHRIDLSVFYRRLQREEFLTLAAIRQSLPLADAIATGFADSRIPESRRAQRVREWFANWAELGWICAPDLESLL
jgi:Putative DNA-binding domain